MLILIQCPPCPWHLLKRWWLTRTHSQNDNPSAVWNKTSHYSLTVHYEHFPWSRHLNFTWVQTHTWHVYASHFQSWLKRPWKIKFLLSRNKLKNHKATFIPLLTIFVKVQLCNFIFFQSKALRFVHLNLHFHPKFPQFSDKSQLKMAPNERWHLNNILSTLEFSDILLKKIFLKGKRQPQTCNNIKWENKIILLFQELQSLLEKLNIKLVYNLKIAVFLSF